MEILDSVETESEKYFNNRKLKLLLLGVIFLGGVIQTYSLFLQYEAWLFTESLPVGMCIFAWPMPFNDYSHYVYELSFLGVIFSFILLKKEEWKTPSHYIDRLIIVSPILLILSNRIFEEIIWRYF